MISNFQPKSWVNPFEKISVWRLCNSQIFIVYVNDHQTLFQGPSVQKHTKIKFPCFDQNHGLSPLKKKNKKKINVPSMKNRIFYSLGGLVFFLKDPQNTISRPILSKSKLR